MNRSRSNGRGYTLVEMLAYIALLGMILSVIYSIYYQFSRTLSAADRTMLKERSALDLTQRLQDDIRRSERVIEESGPFKASDGALILLAKMGEDGEQQIIVYRLNKSKNMLMRYQRPADSSWEDVSYRSFGYDVEAFEFLMDKDFPNLLRISMTLKEGAFGSFCGGPVTFCTMMRNG